MIIKQGKPVFRVYRGEKLVDSIYRGENLVFGGSPYNSEATAALKAAFPEQWDTIREYGRAHTEIVPYVNANPLCAAIWCCYVQDGLVFQMDCNYECTADKWKDVRSTIEFTGNGSVVIQDGVPYFNGSALYKGVEMNHAFTTHTIEIIYKANSNSNALLFMENGSQSINRVSPGIYQGVIITSSGPTGYGMPNYTNHTSLSVISIANTNWYGNRNKLTSAGSNEWGANGVRNTYIGARYEGTLHYTGKIYGIRIYNRLLTEQEILANQDIDIQRWG